MENTNQKVNRKPALKEYVFNFEEGGWNTVMSRTKRGAKKKALSEYAYSKTLNPDLDTVRLPKKNEIQHLCSLFY